MFNTTKTMFNPTTFAGAIAVDNFGSGHATRVSSANPNAWGNPAAVSAGYNLGIVGGIVALWLSGNTLSFAAMIGFVALIGIEIKTSILLVDFTDELRRQGYSLDDAIQRAGEVRFVPIVLTTMTAIGGMLPLALQGSSLYSPLAWVIIGGLVSSTLIARLVTPVMYRLLAPRIDFTQEHPVPEAPPTATGAGA